MIRKRSTITKMTIIPFDFGFGAAGEIVEAGVVALVLLPVDVVGISAGLLLVTGDSGAGVLGCSGAAGVSAGLSFVTGLSGVGVLGCSGVLVLLVCSGFGAS